MVFVPCKAVTADRGEIKWAVGKGVVCVRGHVFSLSFLFSLINYPEALAHHSRASGSLLIFPLLLAGASSWARSSFFGRAVDGTHSREAL